MVTNCRLGGFNGVSYIVNNILSTTGLPAKTNRYGVKLSTVRRPSEKFFIFGTGDGAEDSYAAGPLSHNRMAYRHPRGSLRVFEAPGQINSNVGMNIAYVDGRAAPWIGAVTVEAADETSQLYTRHWPVE